MSRLPTPFLERAAAGAAEVLSRNLGAQVTPGLMLDIRETPAGLCELVLEVLGLEPGAPMRLPVESRFPRSLPAPAVSVPTWRFRALEDLITEHQTPPPIDPS